MEPIPSEEPLQARVESKMNCADMQTHAQVREGRKGKGRRVSRRPRPKFLCFFFCVQQEKDRVHILVWPTKAAGHTSLAFCSRLRRLRISKNAQEISDPIDEQERRDPDVTPGQSVPCRNVCKRIPAHRQVRGVDMANVGNSKSN